MTTQPSQIENWESKDLCLEEVDEKGLISDFKLDRLYARFRYTKSVPLEIL